MELGVFTEQKSNTSNTTLSTVATNMTSSPPFSRGASPLLSSPLSTTTQITSSSLLASMQSTPIPVVPAIEQYISKLANMAKIDTKVERLAIDIAHKTNNHFLADGKAPNGLAAAYIYLAAVLLGVNLLQVDISSLAGVTEVTIRNRCKDILTSFKLIISVKPLMGMGLG